ncbi:MAG: murein biosynthesis integral membrane protein MurJ, partial [Fimbriimonadaceae bacterium]|nr:murein biosynthesis integral membrane protein MurJ [Fimbriimonadaceae bacterium]
MSQDAEKTSAHVARSSGIMVVSVFASRVLGLVTAIVITALFGQNLMTDAYRLSFQIPDLVFYLIAGGALSSAFIPVFTELREQGKESEGWVVFSGVATTLTAVLLVILPLLMIFADPLARVFFTGASNEKMQMAVQMSRIIIPAQLAFFLGGLMFGALYCKGNYSYSAVGINFYNIGQILGAFTLSSIATPAIASMSWGGLIGAYAGNILLPMYALTRLGARYTPGFHWRHPGVRKVFRLMAPVIFGLSLPGVFPVIMQWFTSFLPDGYNSAYDSANRLQFAPQGVFGTSLALAAFPTLSAAFTNRDMKGFSRQLLETARATQYLAVPCAVIMVLLPYDVIQVVFQRGSFTVEDTLRTAPILAAFGVGVFAWCLQPVLMRGFFAMQETLRPVILGTITTAVFILLCGLALGFGLPAWSFAAAGSVGAMVFAVLLLFGIKKRL